MKKIILLSVLLSSPLCATVAPIVSGQSLWWIVKRIGLSVDTIESKVDLIDTSTTQNACGVVDISSADVVGGTLAISTPGSYCLTEDITADITIGSSSVSLSLSGRRVMGTIQITSGSYINISNGFVTPPQPTGSDPAGIDVALGVSKLFIDNVVVECTDAAASSGDAGRDGMSIAGDDIQVRNCMSIAGAGGSAATGGAGGSGIVFTTDASDIVLANCIVIGGDGAASSGADGGAGGHGVAIEGADDLVIDNCTVFRAGDGGITSAVATGGAGGHGIACITGVSNNVFIKNCTIQKSGTGGGGTGTGGDGGHGILIASVSNTKIAVGNCTISDMGAGGDSAGTNGDGGNGLFVGIPNTDISVHHCTISNSGAAGGGLGAAGTAGKAVADAVSAGAGGSKVYANMAHDIANSIRYDLQGITSVEAGFDVSNPPTSTAVNLYANVFM